MSSTAPTSGREADVVGGLDGAADELVHHLHRRRHDAGRDDGGDRVGGVDHAVELGQQDADASGTRISRTSALVTMPSVPSEPTMTPVRS